MGYLDIPESYHEFNPRPVEEIRAFYVFIASEESEDDDPETEDDLDLYEE